jgi:hypothetical protein
MERIVIRPARVSDAADLARNWIETRSVSCTRTGAEV